MNFKFCVVLMILGSMGLAGAFGFTYSNAGPPEYSYPADPHYQIKPRGQANKPARNVVLPDTMRKAVYRMLDTQSADEISHPEKIVKSTQPRRLPRTLSVLEKAPSSFIYRTPGVVI